MKDLIKKLVETWGPSGFEHRIRDLIRAEVEKLADEIEVDALGNMICRMGKAKKDGIRVMIAAHMDEIGLMVSHIDDDGYLRFTNLGGLFPNTLYGNRVLFENGTIGTIGVDDSWGDRSHVPDLKAFYVDVSTGDGKSPVKVGDAAGMWRTMDERGNRLIAKSMDDRIGCAIAIEAMRCLKKAGSPHEVYFAFTVQEEVGCRGATTAAFALKPDLGIALDVTLTGDTPKGLKMAVELGKGVAIKALDGRHIVPPAVKDLLIKTAEANKIPYQIEILSGGTTDASAIQLVQSGAPTGTLSIPCRDVHTVSETVDMTDVQATTDLLVAVLSKPIEGIKPAV